MSLINREKLCANREKSAPKIHHFFTVSFSLFTSSWEKVLGRVLEKGSQKGSEKRAFYGFYSKKGVLRRVLRRGSEKGVGVSRRCLERPLGEYDPLGVRPTFPLKEREKVSQEGQAIEYTCWNIEMWTMWLVENCSNHTWTTRLKTWSSRICTSRLGNQTRSNLNKVIIWGKQLEKQKQQKYYICCNTSWVYKTKGKSSSMARKGARLKSTPYY